MKLNCLTCMTYNCPGRIKDNDIGEMNCSNYTKIKIKHTPIKDKNGNIFYWMEVEK